MKNLNRKLSVIALSGMAVFGGVAASGVQAFAAPKASIEQKNDDIRAKLEVHLRKYDYRIKEEFSSKEEARQAALKLKREGKFKVYGGVRVLKESNADKLLYRLWSQNFERVAVEFEGKFFLIGLDYRM